MTQEMRRWYAVRCCCQPTKVFGFIQLPDNADKYRIPTKDGYADVYVKRLESVNGDFSERTSELAVYSDDRPIEFWRGIPGFLEVVENA